MSNSIILKNSDVAGKKPGTDDLKLGEAAVNTTDGKIFIKKSVDGAEEIIEIGSGGLEPVYINEDTTLVKGKLYVCETSGETLGENEVNYTLTLPDSPEDGDLVGIMDGNSNAQNRPIKVISNNDTIDGTTDPLICDVNYFNVALVFEGGDWRLGGNA